MFHFIWKTPNLLIIYKTINLFVIDFLLNSCGFLLELFQYNIEMDQINRILRIQGTIGVTVGEPCIGYDITALFIALILSSRGTLIKKMWFIPSGVLLILIMNLLRISGLAVLVIINQEIWELNHKLIFTLIVYTFIFLMWRFWLKISSFK